MEYINDTIAAISTPIGEGGIGIVRLSGEKSLGILKNIFVFPSVEKEFEDRKMIYGYIFDRFSGKKIDEVMAVYMKTPKTYTGEDIVEIHGHGSIIALNNILSLVLKEGSRIAAPGEFTKRAFLNGRIDLSQAEAVTGLIRAKTDKSFEIAMNQLEGRLSVQVGSIRDDIFSRMALIEAHIDFCEEELPPLSVEEIGRKNDIWLEKITKWLEAAEEGRVFSEGVRAVIMGKPNVGKSSILNTLIKKDRAIVTDIPGTTRDILYEWVSFKGVPFKIVDTAGVRFSSDYVEKIGVEKALDEMEEADLVLIVLDASSGIDDEDRKTIEHAAEKKKKVIVVLNKVDLKQRLDFSEIEKYIKEHEAIVKTSALNEIGFEELKEEMFNVVCSGSFDTNEYLVSNARHINLLKETKNSLLNVKESISKNMDIDFIAIDLRGAWSKLGEIIGETIEADIANKIFSEFCIGK
ncbi:MAG: tRNA uridine-5-carboxymethylaminomethyl(34) synthesis GTPase MnmE [Armatimonadota bacterium]